MRCSISAISAIAFVCLSFFSVGLNAEQKALTETGEEVILNDNGTWYYETEALASAKEIGINEAKFEKPPNASFRLQSKNNDASIWIDPSQWGVSPSDVADNEYQLKLKDGDLYANVVTEGLEIPVSDVFIDIIISNYKSAGMENLHITQKEYRMVNGNKVLFVRTDGLVMGLDFAFLGYYTSNATGTTQLVAYTSTKLVDQYLDKIEQLLNGLAMG